MIVSTVTLSLSALSVLAYNLKSGPDGKKKEFERAMRKNDFDRILFESMEHLHPIAISLDNRKVYVGLVFDAIEPDSDNSYLTIMPFLSGFRDKDTLSMKIQSTYEPVIDALLKREGGKSEIDVDVLKNYFMAFPRDTIASLHLYNDHLYQNVQKQIAGDDQNGPIPSSDKN